MRAIKVAVLFAVLALPTVLGGQQVADTLYRPNVSPPSYRDGTGPLVLLDEAHWNFHTVAGRYRPFVQLLERDGYTVRPNRAKFSRAALDPSRLLVIANALSPENAQRWTLPNPSAFDDGEIAAVRDWVREGGSLLLIADHMPFGGAAEKLALEFGAVFNNGFAFESQNDAMIRFRRADNSLAVHPIVEGRSVQERIDSLTSFTGQAFRLLNTGAPLMVLHPGTTLLLPIEAWQFSDSTPRIRADGLLQGAAIEFGRGRVVLLAEAAMLSAQLAGPGRQPMGMNHPVAGQNAQFALNIVRWLSHVY